MARKVSLFPTYENIGDQNIFKFAPFEFFYPKDNNEYPLTAKTDRTNRTIISDEKGIWLFDEYKLGIKKEIEIKGANQLYGSSGIACSNAQLGLGLSWYSHDSNQRDVVPIGIVSNSKGKQVLRLSYFFEAASLRGTLTFEIVLYIHKAGNPQKYEKIFANKAGVILGILDTYTITFDSNGSSFPIYEEYKPGEPLWRVSCEFTDPQTEAFGETVYIYLNKAHECYKYIDRESTFFNPQLLAETLGDALAIIVEHVRFLDKDFQSISSAEPGSVAQAIYYFNNKLGWNFQDPETTSVSIRKYLETKFL